MNLFVHVMGGVARPGNSVAQYHSSDGRAKAVGFSDPEIDSLIDAAKLEFDPEARGKIFQQLELLLIDTMYVASLSSPQNIRMQQPWIHDWRDNRASRQSIMNPHWIWMDVDVAPSNRLS